MNDYSELPSFPASSVGGRARPRRLPADPFSSPVPAWAEILEADRETVPMVPLKHHRSYLLDDGPRSEIRKDDMMEIRRKYGVSPLVEMRCSSEYKHAPDGGDNEITVFEAYLKAGFRGVIPFLVAAVSSYIGLCPSQLIPLTWRTLIAIQVLGGILWLFHRSTRDVSRPVSFNGEAVVKLAVEIPRRFRGVAFLTSKEALHHSRVWGKLLTLDFRLGQNAKRHPFYVPPPRLARTIPRATSFSSRLPGDAESIPNQDLETGAHQRLLGEVIFLRAQVRDMMAQCDLLIQRVRALARWKLMREWLEKRIDHWDPAGEYRRYLFYLEVLTGLWEDPLELIPDLLWGLNFQRATALSDSVYTLTFAF
ncbi:hypothetical protein Bca101_010519 [Brassica carinata]